MLLYLFVGIIFLSILHCYFKYNEKTRLLREIPGPKDIFLIGNALDIFLSPVELFKRGEIYARKFNGLYSVFSFLNRNVVIYNPEDAEVILSNTKHSEKSILYRMLKPWLREGLLISHGSKWQHRRKIITPTFHFNILSQFFNTFEENSRLFVEILLKTEGESADIMALVSEYTLNNLCETAMGTPLDEETNYTGEYKEAISKLGRIFLERCSKIYLWDDLIFKLSSLGRQSKQHLHRVHSFTKKVISKRTKFVHKYGINVFGDTGPTVNDDIYSFNRKKRAAMLDVLISAEKEGVIDQEGIQEEVDTFMVAGNETTSTTLTFCLILLANNRKIQNKIVTELQNIFEDSTRPATMEDLSMMRYLECCIKECLRLYPPAHFIGRKINEAVKLSNYTIPAGTHCHIHIMQMHRREELFENADGYDPDRFLAENSTDRHPYAYIPFSAGPRNCIGQRFAMMQMKSCLAAVLRKFELFSVTKRSELELTADLVLRTTRPVYVKFIARK